jgi:hypothetical protein
VIRYNVESLAADVQHGPVLVEAALAHLLAARAVLSDDEILAVLEADAVVVTDLRERSPHWPLADVMPYVCGLGCGPTSLRTCPTTR